MIYKASLKLLKTQNSNNKSKKRNYKPNMKKNKKRSKAFNNRRSKEIVKRG